MNRNEESANCEHEQESCNTDPVLDIPISGRITATLSNKDPYRSDFMKYNLSVDDLVLKVLIWYQSKSEKYRQQTLLVDAVKDFKLHSN